MAEDLIDRIYEAAFVPELWADTLEAACHISDSASGTIFIFREGSPVRGRLSSGSDNVVTSLFAEFVAGDTWKFSDSVQRMCGVQPASFVQVDDFLTAKEIELDPVRSSLRAAGIGAHICTAIAMPSGDLVTFVFQRWLKSGRYDSATTERLDQLRPHLARAGLMAARLGMERAQAMMRVMQQIGLPAAVMTNSGRVLAANALLEDMGSIFLPVAFGGMAIADEDANRIFQETIQSARTACEPVARSIPIAATQDRRPLIIHILPLRRAAHDIFSGADMLVVATKISSSSLVPSPAVLSGLFDLTPAEAKLASALSQGQSLKSVAARSNITVKTGRTYLERIFAKTGTHQQSELVALLKSAELLRPRQ
jgi:DNA-binding CsgD family transcriptional regulator